MNFKGKIMFQHICLDIEFQPGDVVYWRSPDGEKKFSVALLYGHTSFGNWTSSRTSSPCIKIGRITTDTNLLKTVTTNESATISINNSNIL